MRPHPLLPALLVALGCAALPAEAQTRVRSAEAALPRAPTLPPAPRLLAPGSLDHLGDWTRPLLFRGSRLSLPAEVRLYLCPRGGTPQRGGRCRPPAGGGPGSLLAGGPDQSAAGWHEGLRPASHAQRSCPAGTAPTVARDNPGVTRCLPT